MILYMYIALRQGQTAPRGQSCDVNRNVTSSICCKFKKQMSLKSDFILLFNDLVHVYSPGAGAGSPQWIKILMSTEMSCHFIHLLQVSKQSL